MDAAVHDAGRLSDVLPDRDSGPHELVAALDELEPVMAVEGRDVEQPGAQDAFLTHSGRRQRSFDTSPR
jgi:hypothetical protein